MNYMLDTNILIDCLRSKKSTIEVIKKHGKTSALHISTVVLGELFVGLKKNDTPRRRAALNKVLAPIRILDFDKEAAKHFGLVKSKLEAKGNVIGSYDMQIAGHALAQNMTLITHNTKEFSRVDKLKIKDWLSNNI